MEKEMTLNELFSCINECENDFFITVDISGENNAERRED